MSLFGCLACISASVTVLVKSDGQPTSSWTWSPTVYLALFTAGTNTFARFAFNEGAAIAWWHKAIRGGTVKELHNHFAYSNGFLTALFSRHGGQFSPVALVSFALALLIIDQPLIQRASTVVSVSRTSIVNVTAPIAPEIPWGFTGHQTSDSIYESVMTQPMIAAFNDYNS
jgi:hypothetical protein